METINEFNWFEIPTQHSYESLSKENAEVGSLYYFDGTKFIFAGNAIPEERKRNSKISKLLIWLAYKIDNL